MFFRKKTKNIASVNFQINNPNDHSQALNLEWLETNGVGGWASSTIYGTNTRRYHGLLVAAVDNLEDRRVLVANQIETLIIEGQSYDLSSFAFPGVLHPEGFRYLKTYHKDPISRFVYEISYQQKTIQIIKTIVLPQGTNCTSVSYEIKGADSLQTSLQVEPFFACRPYHQVQLKNQNINFSYQFNEKVMSFHPKDNYPQIYTRISSGAFEYAPRWFNNLEFFQEDSRGYEYREDWFSLGKFKIEITNGTAEILYSDFSPVKIPEACHIIESEKKYRQNLLMLANAEDEITAKLVLAADQFLVHSEKSDCLLEDSQAKTNKTKNHLSIIAGYHWFTDWGRDGMIALPGLCLATGRTKEAQQILTYFADKMVKGLIPNRIKENQEIEYNSVDASLWFIDASYQYYLLTKDKKWLKEIGLQKIREVISYYLNGTLYDIRVCEDGLLRSGNAETQLTWMDAKIGEWVVTPRYGKAVEVNALWYNALKIAHSLEKIAGSNATSKEMLRLANKCNKSFEDSFWYSAGGYLYDVVRDDFKDASLRPNQLLALSLSFPIINGEKAKQIIRICKDKLLTPFGLRTLAADDINYRGSYYGDVVNRDSSYHQGTVWCWLLGPYCRANIKIFGAQSYSELQVLIKHTILSMEQAGIGTLSEIFDGNYPHRARGCIAQAWSNAEVLSVWKELIKLKKNHR